MSVMISMMKLLPAFVTDRISTPKIKALTKKANSPVLVSESTYVAVKDKFSRGRQFKAVVKGKAEPITVYELLFD